MADIKLSGRRIEVSIIMNKMTICPTAMVTTLERKGDIWHKIITSGIRRWDQDRSTVEACNSDMPPNVLRLLILFLFSRASVKTCFQSDTKYS